MRAPFSLPLQLARCCAEVLDARFLRCKLPVAVAGLTGAGVAGQGGPTTRTFSGSGANEDIVVASVRAYVSALNRLIAYVSANQRAVEAAQSADEPEMAAV
jgi:2-isopropylmalate synthase